MIQIFIFLFLIENKVLCDEFNEFDVEESRPHFIPEVFNDKQVQPLVPGDFEEYWELWTGRQYFNGNETVNDLFLMKTRYHHRTYEGVKVGSIPYYGSDLRFIPGSERDILLMTNGRELDIFTLWGRRKIEISTPIRNYKYQFIYQNWLFINETHVLDLDYALNSGKPLTEQNLFWDYSLIPWDTLEKTVLDYISKHCFTLGYHCIIDPDDSRLLMSNTEVVSYRSGLKMSVLETGYSIQTQKHHFYMLEDDITNLSFYVPPDLETFTRPVNFPYQKRHLIFPNPKKSDRFITTRRHQIFVRNNRVQFQSHLPTSEPCNCKQQQTEKEPQVYYEQPLSFAFASRSISTIVLTLVFMYV